MINFHRVELVCSIYEKGAYPRLLPEVALVGRSNVGKSSLINRILGRKSLARVSASPGKTRSINFYCVDEKMYLTDLPGYGFAQVGFEEREKWRRIIDRYFAADRDLRVVIMLVDIRHDPSREDCRMVDYLCSLGVDFLIVASKADKLSKKAAEENCRRIAEVLGLDSVILPFSARSGEGADTILDIIKERCDVDYGEN